MLAMAERDASDRLVPEPPGAKRTREAEEYRLEREAEERAEIERRLVGGDRELIFYEARRRDAERQARDG